MPFAACHETFQTTRLLSGFAILSIALISLNLYKMIRETPVDSQKLTGEQFLSSCAQIVLTIGNPPVREADVSCMGQAWCPGDTNRSRCN